MSVIYLYWPGKPIPEWLQRVEFSGKSRGTPICCHRGIGVVVCRSGTYHVHHLCGDFIYIYGAGMSVKLTGGGDGVCIHIPRWWRLFSIRD